MEVYIEWLKERIFKLETDRISESNKINRKSLNDRLRELRLCLKNAQNCK